MTVNEILEENRHRNHIIETPYDPIAGNPRDPARFLFEVEGLDKVYIPSTMKEDPLVCRLLESESLRSLFPDEREREKAARKFMMIRCRHDFPYWAARFAYIKRKKGGDDILFVLNRPQRKLVNTLERMRREGKPIRLLLLKARQWGGSTCVQLYMVWLQLIHRKGLNSLIIAHQGSATDEIKDMFDRVVHSYPEDLLEDFEALSDDSLMKNTKGTNQKSKGGRSRKAEKTESTTVRSNGKKAARMERVGRSGSAFRIPARNCKVKVGSAERPDSCRGGDYSLVHCSEVGLWRVTQRKTPEQIVRAACSGVLLEPLTMIVYESTANGTGNFFHREYEAAKNGESQFAALFVSWFEIEQYSLPFANELQKEQFARLLLEGRKAEQTLSARRQPGCYLWWLWERGATLEALHWYVGERAKYSDHGLMAAEYPSDDVEAFVHSGARVFDKYKVEAMRKDCRKPVWRGEIDGDGCSGPESLRNLRFNPDANGGLAVWKDREKNGRTRVRDRYLVVVDIGGRSAKSDWSVIAVFDREPMTRGELPEIVAQWRGHADFDLLAWNACRIASYYETALLVIESNTLETHDRERLVDGDQSHFLLNQLRDAYPNLYARRRSEADIRDGMPVKYGFHTNTATKPMVISMLVKAVREKLYVERDEEALSELLAYEQRQDGSYGALPGFHDDILMTRAIGLHICFNDMEMPRVVEKGSEGYNHYRKNGFF